MGIGRGMQVINVVLGGTLYQDIELVMKLNHPIGESHRVTTTADSKIANLLGPTAVVNSFHHQAVKTVGVGLKATAMSEDGIIEALEHETLPVFGVQWHPETQGTDDEEVRTRHAEITELPQETDTAEAERQSLAIMVKKAIPGCATDADIELPVGNPLFEYFLELIQKGGR